jgi:hypothetical protein
LEHGLRPVSAFAETYSKMSLAWMSIEIVIENELYVVDGLGLESCLRLDLGQSLYFMLLPCVQLSKLTSGSDCRLHVAEVHA